MEKLFKIVLLLLVLVSCKKNYPSISIEELQIPKIGNVSSTPNLYQSPQGNLFLSWIEQKKDSSFLLYAKLANHAWSAPLIAAQGDDWVINWADFPSISTYPSSELSVLAQYLQLKDTAERYHYDVKLAFSRDGGEHFRPTQAIHDSIPAEHGFVSLLPYSYDKVLAVWLDGSAQAKSEVQKSHAEHDHANGAAMQLMSALIDFDGNIKERLLIDDRVCDCCQTDVCMTALGPILVYRNRSDDEIRDIYYTKYHEGKWSTPKPIHDDHWKINGCPVNGPSIAAIGNNVAVAWYTESNKVPKLQLTYSNNAGDSFTDPIEIQTSHTLGRLDIVWIDDDHIAVSYLDKSEIDSELATLKLYVYSIKDTQVQSFDIDKVSSKRKSGFPILDKKNTSIQDNELYLAYTQLSNDNITTIKTVKVNIH